LKNGVDVSIYVNKLFTVNQMMEIRLGLEDGLDVSVCAFPEFNELKMAEYRQSLKKKKNSNVENN